MSLIHHEHTHTHTDWWDGEKKVNTRNATHATHTPVWDDSQLETRTAKPSAAQLSPSRARGGGRMDRGAESRVLASRAPIGRWSTTVRCWPRLPVSLLFWFPPFHFWTKGAAAIFRFFIFALKFWGFFFSTKKCHVGHPLIHFRRYSVDREWHSFVSSQVIFFVLNELNIRRERECNQLNGSVAAMIWTWGGGGGRSGRRDILTIRHYRPDEFFFFFIFKTKLETWQLEGRPESVRKGQECSC